MLHFFCVALASCCIFSEMQFLILYSFQVALFSCHILFMLHLFLCLCFVLYFFCVAFFSFALFSSCTSFVLYTFRVAPFGVALFFFMLQLFSCCTVFMLYLLCTLFCVAHFFVLHFSFLYRTLFIEPMLHFFRVVPFSGCTFLYVALFSCCTFSRVVSCCTLLMLHFFCVALFWYWTFFRDVPCSIAFFLYCFMFDLATP